MPTVLRVHRARSGSAQDDGIFPLPLAPFEYMMLTDDSSAYPMTCGAAFRFQGKVHRPLLTRCLEEALRRHPLLHARIERTGFQRWAWVRSEESPAIAWLKENDPEPAGIFARFDLTNETGLRTQVRENQGGTTLNFEFHHSCSDGVGGMVFVEDVFALYDAGMRGQSLSSLVLPPLDLQRLRDRARFQRPGQSWFDVSRNLIQDTALACKLGLQFPSPIAAPRTAPGVARVPHVHRMESLVINAVDVARMRQEAVAYNSTLNDVLLRNLFRTVLEWNRMHGAGQANELYRIVMPVNLRSRQDALLPATNRMSYGFAMCRAKHLQKSSFGLQAVGADNMMLRREGQPQSFLRHLSGLVTVRIGIPLVFSPRRCLATTVLSNLGDPMRRFRTRFQRVDGLLRIGNLLLTDFQGTVGMRSLTRAGFCVNSYGNRLSLTGRFDPACFSTADARAFLQMFAAYCGVSHYSIARAA